MISGPKAKISLKMREGETKYDIDGIEGYSWYSFHHTGDIYSPSKSIWNHNDLEKVNVWEVF